jgi:hypothetical protein
MSTHTPLEVESVLAAIGPEKILRGEPTFLRRQFVEAQGLPKQMREAFDKFYASAKFEPSEKLPPFDYDAILDLVKAKQLGPEQTDALATVMPDADMAMELGLEGNRIMAWADQVIPRNPSTTLAGTTMDPPDAESLAQFRTRWQVATDPMVVVRDMLEGCLDPDQVSTLALLYPTLYQEMRQAESDARTAAAMEHGKGWEPEPAKAAQVTTLLQTTPFDPKLAASVQQTYQAAAERKPTVKPPKRQSSNTSDLTPGQKAAAGTTT